MRTIEVEIAVLLQKYIKLFLTEEENSLTQVCVTAREVVKDLVHLAILIETSPSNIQR